MTFRRKTAEAMASRIGQLLGGHWQIEVVEDGAGSHTGPGINIKPGSGAPYSECDLDFGKLCKIADICGTKHINVIWNEGWSGTELTGGDPAELVIEIRKLEGRG